MKQNHFMLTGLVGAKPELKVSKNGNEYLSFSIAVNEKYKGKDGEEKEVVNWFQFVVFGDLAESLSKSLDKGKKVVVEGKMTKKMVQSDPKKYEVELQAKSVNILEKREKKEKASEESDDSDLFSEE